MEDVLGTYEQPYDATQPMICFDETSKQLVGETRCPLPMEPGQAARYDYEYERHGTRNLFMFFEPLTNYRHVRVTERRTNRDFAHCMRWLAEEAYPEAVCIHVVLDNLSTHTYAALYDTFEPAQARSIARRIRFHYTPKHGSWLNMAEIEFSVLSRVCLKQRIPDEATLVREVQALVNERNAKGATVNWQFTAADARTKLKRLYPVISS